MQPVNRNPKARQIFITKQGDIRETQTLDLFLTTWLEIKAGITFSRSDIRKLVRAGAIEINRRIAPMLSMPVGPSDTIRVEIENAMLDYKSARQKTDAKFTNNSSTEVNGSAKDHGIQFPILYQDEWIIVVSKPVGLPTQPTLDPTRPNLFDLLNSSGKFNYLGLHHRLDRDTSGAILFTLKKEANVGVAALFKERRIHKTYSALTVPTQIARKDAWTRKDFLKRDPRNKKMNKMISVRAGGDFAETDFKILKKNDSAMLVQASPKTGRMHQIRVHLSEDGIPILGDTLYGAPKESAPRVMLHAHRLEFSHPMNNNPMVIEVPPPADFLALKKKIFGEAT